ncbi:serine hydrolase [Streptomyces boninensis]|uniref:serine hydrolase n=1 Tax=Streptomyces boninensis TaxID=2039455 RepID=UPI003B2186CA
MTLFVMIAALAAASGPGPSGRAAAAEARAKGGQAARPQPPRAERTARPGRAQPLRPPAPRRNGTPTPSRTPSPSASRTASADEAVRAALDGLGGHAGRYAIAVRDMDTGAYASYGEGTGTYDTASIVKVDILAALLLRHQARGTEPTAGQRELAADMIRSSDNDATDALWRAIGGTAGLDAANEALGLSGTSAGEFGRWGLTQTVPADQIRLLRAVFGDDSPLGPQARAFIAGLMGRIVPGQDWGVPAAADPGAPRVLKNGWLRRSTTDLWDINSIGLVPYDGHLVLVAVLSADQPSREDGIALVERAAAAAVPALVDNASP